MPKKPTGFSKSGAGSKSTLEKEVTPDKTPALKANSLPVGNRVPKGTVPLPMDGGPNKVASMPGQRSTYPKLSRPAQYPPRQPRI